MSRARLSLGLFIVLSISITGTSQGPTSPDTSTSPTQTTQVDDSQTQSTISYDEDRVIGLVFMRCHPLPRIANADVTMSRPLPLIRTVAKIRCYPGSTIVGANTLECDPIKYSVLETGGWSAKVPVCQPILESTDSLLCTLPQLPRNSIYLHLQTSIPINHVASYVCNNSDIIILYPLLCTRKSDGTTEMIGNTNYCNDMCNNECDVNARCVLKIPPPGQMIPIYDCECKKPEYIGNGYKCAKNPCLSPSRVCGPYENCDVIQMPVLGMTNYKCSCKDGFFRYNNKCAPILYN